MMSIPKFIMNTFDGGSSSPSSSKIKVNDPKTRKLDSELLEGGSKDESKE